MQDNSKRTKLPAAAGNGNESTTEHKPTREDRRVERTVDLTDEDIIAVIEGSEMAPAFEHLNAEVDET